MKSQAFFERKQIKGKDVYVVVDHHKVLAAWAGHPVGDDR